MMPLAGRFQAMVHGLLRRLPMSDYQKTRLWATSLPFPVGSVKAWPYYRSMHLVSQALASPDGYGGMMLDPGGSYSVIEFGVARGGGLELMLHCRDTCIRKFNLTNKIYGLGFDTFEGLPSPRAGDEASVWRTGDYPGDIEVVQKNLEKRFSDFRLIKGYFSESLPGQSEFLRANPPVFVSIDCDYYSSTMDVFDALLPDIAVHGCLFYFDDVSINFYSDRSGELKAIREINEGRYGEGIQLVEYPLWIETGEMRHYKQMYRLFNLQTVEKHYEEIYSKRDIEHVTRNSRLSPL